MQRTTGGSFSCSLQFILFRKGKDEKPGKLKVNMLFNCAGPEAIEVRTMVSEPSIISTNCSMQRHPIQLCKEVEIKADTGAEATWVIPYHRYEKITKKPLQQIRQSFKEWLATKPIHPRGCVRLPTTRCKNRRIDFLYIFVDGNITSLLGCDACLNLEVLSLWISNRLIY